MASTLIKEDSERRLPGLGIVLVVTLSIDRGHTCAFESVSSEGQTVCQEESSHEHRMRSPKKRFNNVEKPRTTVVDTCQIHPNLWNRNGQCVGRTRSLTSGSHSKGLGHRCALACFGVMLAAVRFRDAAFCAISFDSPFFLFPRLLSLFFLAVGGDAEWDLFFELLSFAGVCRR